MRGPIVLSVLAIVLLTACAATTVPANDGLPYAVRNAEQCDPFIDQSMAALDLEGLTVESQFYTRERILRGFLGLDEDAFEPDRGFVHYTRFAECQGTLVLEIDRRCQVEQQYTRGQCDVPGLVNYF